MLGPDGGWWHNSIIYAQPTVCLSVITCSTDVGVSDGQTIHCRTLTLDGRTTVTNETHQGEVLINVIYDKRCALDTKVENK